MRDHNKLRAFQLSDDLVFEIYRISGSFPKHEIFGLTSQIRRAVVSICSNIVEGCSRQSQNEYHRFLEIAYSSLKESHYQFDLSRRLGYVNESEAEKINSKFLETEKVLGTLVIRMRIH
jgi:four helix bundle protein